MNSQVCVNCHNKKNVNLTDNRLVTESCGHVKCMDCLLREKSGCSACNEQTQKIHDSGLVSEIEVALDADNIQGRPAEVIDEEDSTERKLLHIKIKLDGNTKRYYCEPCDKLFRSRSQVAYHAYCGGQRKPYQCPQCDKGFSTHSHYKYHMRVHRNERAYPCEICGESFFQMSKLQRHKLKHTKEKKYVCELCKKAFNNFSALRKHGLTHTDERPYKCEACNRRFRDRSNYKKHEAKHKVGPCRVCGPRAIKIGDSGVATEAESPAATGATGAESPEATGATGATGAGQMGRGCTHAPARRPHQCPRCPQTFHSKKDMRRHAQVHTDTKAFRCKICNRRFRRKDNLERHIRNTHPQHDSSGAVDCDGGVATNGTKPDDPPTSANTENFESTKLKILNPLPPLPEDVIQKHMYADKQETVDQSVDQSVNRSKRASVRTERYKMDHTNSERDEKTLIEIAENGAKNGHANPSAPTYTNDIDRTKIKILNPPLPQGLIQKHMYAGKCEPVLDKSYILEANNARQSVIVGNCPIDRRISSPVPEYVHKIRKANSISSSKDSLPPIDEEKLLELGTRSSLNKLDVGAPHPKNIETYKNILYDKLEKPRGDVKVSASPEMHWRRKMLNMNW